MIRRWFRGNGSWDLNCKWFSRCYQYWLSQELLEAYQSCDGVVVIVVDVIVTIVESANTEFGISCEYVSHFGVYSKSRLIFMAKTNVDIELDISAAVWSIIMMVDYGGLLWPLSARATAKPIFGSAYSRLWTRHRARDGPLLRARSSILIQNQYTWNANVAGKRQLQHINIRGQPCW